MNSDSINRIVGGIDDDLIRQAEEMSSDKRKMNVWGRRLAAASAVIAAVIVGAVVLPGFLHTEPMEGAADSRESSNATDFPTGTVSSAESTTSPETAFSKMYVYSVDEGAFSGYEPGRVIEEAKLGEKIGSVGVTGGWMDAEQTMLTEEHAQAEVYLISGVSENTAVAIRFLDKLEAMTLNHYYVILNPEADLSAVSEYVIPKINIQKGEE